MSRFWIVETLPFRGVRVTNAFGDPSVRGWALHVAALGLVALDLGSRSRRIQLTIRAAGGAIGLRDAVALTAVGDAAAAVTPWRAGGEAGRGLGGPAPGGGVPGARAGVCAP